jgi:hypothetical protein
MALPEDFTAASIQDAPRAEGTDRGNIREILGGREFSERLGSPYRDSLRRAKEEGLIKDRSLFAGGASDDRPTGGRADGFHLIDPAELDLRRTVNTDPLNERGKLRIASPPDSTLRTGAQGSGGQAAVNLAAKLARGAAYKAAPTAIGAVLGAGLGATVGILGGLAVGGPIGAAIFGRVLAVEGAAVGSAIGSFFGRVSNPTSIGPGDMRPDSAAQSPSTRDMRQETPGGERRIILP